MFKSIMFTKILFFISHLNNILKHNKLVEITQLAPSFQAHKCKLFALQNQSNNEASEPNIVVSSKPNIFSKLTQRWFTKDTYSNYVC